MFSNYSYAYFEDDEMSRNVTKLIMETAMGVDSLTCFPDSMNFLEKLHALPRIPDLIILDIHLEPHDGFTILEGLRADTTFENTRIVALTASVMANEIAQIQAAGFDAAIAKPISVETFPTLIERILTGEEVWHISDDY